MATPTTCCANHTCSVTTSETDSHVTCSLCLTPMYCSEECRLMDWIQHDCPNAIAVDRVGAIAAMPYAWEDFMSAEVRDTLPFNAPTFQSYLLQSMGSDMKVSQWTQVGDVAGKVRHHSTVSVGSGGDGPSERYADYEYRITVTQDGSLLYDKTGRVKDIAVHPSNPSKRLNALATAFKSELHSSSILLWPNPQEIRNKNITLRNSGELRVTVDMARTSGGVPVSILDTEFRYGTRGAGLSWWREAKGKARKYLDGRYKIKFGEYDDTIKYMSSLRVPTGRGAQINLTFTTLPGQTNEHHFRDIEILIPESMLIGDRPAEPMYELDNAPISFYCDARNINHVNALTMALEMVQADPDSKELMSPDLLNAAGIIRKHTREMNADPKKYVSEAVPVEVNTAVYMATTEIGVIYGERLRKWGNSTLSSEKYKAMLKKMTLPEQFQEEFDNQVRLAQEAQAEGQTGESFISHAKAVINVAGTEDRKKGRLFYVVKEQQPLNELEANVDQIKANKPKRRGLFRRRNQ